MVKRLFFLTLMLFLFFSLPVAASEQGFYDYEKEYEDFISEIPDDLKGLLPDGVFSEDREEMAKAVSEAASPENFFKTVLNMLGFRMKDALGMLARMVALILISSLTRNIIKSSGSSAIVEAFDFCTTSGIAAAFLYEQAVMVKLASDFLQRLLAMVNSMIPIIGVLYAAGGNVSAATSSVSSLGFFLAVCENLCAATLIPAVGICLAFSAASLFSPQFSLGEISATFKKIYTYGLGLLAAILSLVMSIQTQLASKADSLSARAAKYALGSFIPVVGGTVGESFRTVAASVDYIKGAVGGLSIVIILLLLLPPLISLSLGRSAVSISKCVAQMLGCESEAKMLSEIGNIYGYMIAVCSVCAVIFIYALTLFVRCNAALGG